MGTRATHYGSAITAKMAPVPAAEVEARGAITPVAVPLCAESGFDANQRIQAWHALMTARGELDRLSGHIYCSDGTHCRECLCPAWLRDAKRFLDASVQQITGME